MVQMALELLGTALSAWQPLWKWACGLLLVVGVLALWWRLMPQAAARPWLERLRDILAPVGRWGAALLVFGLSWSLLNVLGEVVLHRVSAGEASSSSRGADPDAAPTTQEAPRVTYLTEKSYVRSLTIPPAMIKRVKVEGVQVLAPYLSDPSSENVIRLRDRFLRSGQDIVFQREATLLGEEPIRLDRSNMNVVLEFVSPLQGARRSYYNASFKAQYAFSNPLQTPVTARFNFPLPQGSGTLSDFQVVVDGQELSAADLSSGRGWEGPLRPRQTVNVVVTYRHQGARGWQYLLGARREPIRDFNLSVHTNQPAKFARYSLYPSRQARTLGGTHLSWNLKNVITAQDVSLTFTGSSLRETLTKLYTFAPLALLLAGLSGALWTRWRALRVTPLGVSLASVSVMVGLALGGVLMNYLPAYVAAPLGALVATFFALRALGRAYWPVVLLPTLLPLAFLLLNHAGLVLVLVGVAALAALLWQTPRPWPSSPDSSPAAGGETRTNEATFSGGRF